jgi:hypothetical protein
LISGRALFFSIFCFVLAGFPGRTARGADSTKTEKPKPPEKPVLEHIFPAGASRGSTNVLTLFGKFENWPPKIWTSGSGVEFSFPTNKGKLNAIVSTNAPVRACLLRLYNEGGASEPCIFVVGDGPEIAEAEPNDNFSSPQSVTNLPVTINGRLEKRGDVDSYRIHVRAGEWLDARIDSYTLMSQVDAVLRLTDEHGYQIAWNHDFATLDPRLIWRSPRDQEVVLQVFGFVYPANSEIQLTGGPGGVYRLHVNREASPPPDVFLPLSEHEPNNSRTNAATLSIPGTVAGTICPAGDEDRFRLKVKKDEIIEARTESAALGSQLDSWLKLEDSKGKELARDDDANNSPDPRLEWKAPADGEYFLVIGSVTHQGDEDFRYRLKVTSVSPAYTATLAANELVLSPGSTNTLKFNLKRLRNFTNELTAGIKSLPAGVTIGTASVPAKDGEGSLQLITATNAPAFSAPVEVVLHDKTANADRPIPFELVSRSENNGVPGGYTSLLVESLPHLWLSILPGK